MPGLSLQQNAFFSLPFLFHTSAGPRPSGVRMRSPLQDATQCSEKRKFYPQMTDQFRRVPVDLHFRIFVLCDSPRASLRSVARLHGACGRSRSAALAPALLAGDRRAQASAAPLLLWWSTLQPVRVFRRPLRDTLCVTLLGRLHARPRLPLHRASPLVSRQGFFVRWRSVFHKGLVSRPVLVCLLHGSSPFSLQLIVRVSARASGRPPVSSADPFVPRGLPPLRVGLPPDAVTAASACQYLLTLALFDGIFSSDVELMGSAMRACNAGSSPTGVSSTFFCLFKSRAAAA